MTDIICQSCPRNNTRCKGENRLIPGACQCIEKKRVALKNEGKPKRKKAEAQTTGIPIPSIS